MDSQCDALLWLVRLSWLQHHIPSANVTLYAETDALLARLYLHGLTKLLEVTADLQEFRGGHLDYDLVLLLWDFHVLTLNLHELQLEVSDSIVLSTFALEVDRIRIVLPPQLQRVVCTAHLEYLSQAIH